MHRPFRSVDVGTGVGKGWKHLFSGERTKFQDLSILSMFLSVGSLLISGPWESFIEHSDLSPLCSQRQWGKGKGQETFRPLLACLFGGGAGGACLGQGDLLLWLVGDQSQLPAPASHLAFRMLLRSAEAHEQPGCFPLWACLVAPAGSFIFYPKQLCNKSPQVLGHSTQPSLGFRVSALQRRSHIRGLLELLLVIHFLRNL